MLTCTPHGHLTALCNLGGQKRKMRRPLRSGWEGWTNERVYCWGLPRCHGRRITAAHPSHRWRRAPHVLTGKSLWRVKSMRRASLTYSTTVQKPLRLQLKKATVAEKNISPCGFVFFFERQLTLWCYPVLMAKPQTHNTFHSFSTNYSAHHTAHAPVLHSVPAASPGRRMTAWHGREKPSAADRTRSANTLPLQRHIVKNETPPVAAALTTGGVTDAARLYIAS